MRKNPLAVVTGASSGIGLELAKLFAADGYDLIVVAEDEAINEVAAEIKRDEIAVHPMQIDLATEDGVNALYRRIRTAGKPLDAIALNAGVGAGGAFATGTELSDELRLIDLNVRGTTQLAKLALRDMAARDAGRVLFVSSIASTMPGAFQAVYNASKSFVQSLAVALREELRDSNVTITSLMPGPTETEFFERAGMEDTRVGSSEKDDPADVARDGYEAMMAGRERVVSASLSTKLQGRFSRALPDRAKAAMHRRMAEPGSGDE